MEGAGWWDSRWHTCLKDELWIILASQRVEQKKCVISYVGNHLKPKKNPVCSGSEHKQQEKVQTRNQRGRAGRGDSHLAHKRLARTIREQGPDRAKEKLKGEGRLKFYTAHPCTHLWWRQKAQVSLLLSAVRGMQIKITDKTDRSRNAVGKLLLFLRPSEETLWDTF